MRLSSLQHLVSVFRLTFLCCALVVAGPAGAGEPEASPEEPPRNYVNLRLGASTPNSRVLTCLELAPLAWLSLETCGTGSGILHSEPEREVFRLGAQLLLTSWKVHALWLQPRLGLGFAELQVGQDGPGFSFTGTGASGVETAGPEARASLRLLLPIAGGFECVGELGVSAAYFHYAPQLVSPQAPWQLGLGLSLGFGL
jgi:hypothetical protein